MALTSYIMKTRPGADKVKLFLDPVEFAHQPRLGVEDCIIYLLNPVYAHLDKPASTVSVS